MQSLSVVIPVFNGDRFIRAAVDSCLREPLDEDVEVLVVDDGSTDRTTEVLSAYSGHPSVRYIRQSNAGPAAARNRGIALSQSRFVAFLDADDVYLPGTLGRFLGIARQERPSAAIFYCDFAKIDLDGKPIGQVRVKPPMPPPMLFQQFLLPKAFPVLTSTMMIDRLALEAVGGFDPRFLRCEDLELLTRMIERFEFRKLDFFATGRRSHAGQVTADRLKIIHWREECNIAFLRRTPFEKFCGRSDKIGLATAAEAFGDIMLRAEEPLPRTARYLYEMAQRISPDAQLRGKIEAARALL